ncbi:hypothetical protein IFR05_000210 [Cadophora sp. M221]|nr:hypothetical protein IFR05_000210 [Cadophora sp. M221]
MESKKYRRKICLYVLWNSQGCRHCEHGSGCQEACEVEIFTKTISKGYGFEVLTCRFPNSGSGLSMEDYIKHFIELFSHPDTLILLYYNGHGDYDERHGLDWGPGNLEETEHHPLGPEFYRRPILRQLVSASSDVLIVLDCCRAVPPTREACLSTPLPPQGGKTEIIGACTTAQLSSIQFSFHLPKILQARYKSGRETSWRNLPTYIEQERKGRDNIKWERLLRTRICSSQLPVSSYLKLHSEEETINLTPEPRGVRRMQLEIKKKLKDKLWGLTDGICNHIIHSGSW